MVLVTQPRESRYEWGIGYEWFVVHHLEDNSIVCQGILIDWNPAITNEFQ
jgi:hypothetical protein